MRALVFLISLLMAPVVAVACPNWQGQPHFGQVNLNSGFLPDPYIVNVTAGGANAISRCINGGWAGYVSTRPDFDLYWNGGASQLTIAAESGADTVLLINDPNGNWHWSDDYRGLNPAVTFRNPLQGLYDIWVGTYDGRRGQGARLVITEYNY